MKQKTLKAWLYLLPAILFLGVFMVYPLIDVFIYSFEEGYNSASQTYFGIGPYNYAYVLHCAIRIFCRLSKIPSCLSLLRFPYQPVLRC